MKTLFAKIFIWFFMSLAVLILASFGMTRLTSRDPATVVRRWGDPFRLHADYARETLARDGRDGLVKLLDRMDQTSRLHAFVIDREGHEVRGLPIPAGVDSLSRRILAGQGTGFNDVERHPSFAYPLGAGAGLDSSVLVLMPPSGPPRHILPFVHLPPHDAWIVVVLIGIGGIFCYGLARHITSPVTRLRSAVAKLAAGDLSARVEGNRAIGGDELTALGRDFNRMAERIESLLAAHRQLLRDLSHEIRSPLARIRVAIGLAQQQPDGARLDHEAIGPLLARIEREAERLESLIAQILTLSRLETRSNTTNVEALDLNELVQGIVEDARFEATAKGVDVRLKAATKVRVKGEISVLRSAIENVIRNAVRASSAGSAVEIELMVRPTQTNGDNAVLSVLDRGPGVSEQELETIFEPFTRAEKSRDRMSGGVGLGLAIARRGIESHHGRIHALLRTGGGLVIEIRLPIDGVLTEGRA
jgi:two-component system sensor histidine kinase CpxA